MVWIAGVSPVETPTIRSGCPSIKTGTYPMPNPLGTPTLLDGGASRVPGHCRGTPKNFKKYTKGVLRGIT
jgi:hypothetical protein